MNKFKLNSNKLVNKFLENSDLVKPDIGTLDFKIRSVAFTPLIEEKLERMRAKYKLSRSAMIRILIDKAEV